MSATLKDFLVDLACDPDRLAKFLADPEGEIERAGLDTSDRAAILARDSRAIHEALGTVPTDHMTNVFIARGKKVARKGAKKAGARKAARKTGARKSAKKR